MPQKIQWSLPSLIQTALDTQLNGLPNGSYSSASTDIPNESGRYRFMAVEIYLASLTPVANQTVTLHLLSSLDGTNYADGGGSVRPESATARATFLLANQTRAFRLARSEILIPPLRFKLVLGNDQITNGVPLAGSGNLVRVRLYGEELA